MTPNLAAPAAMIQLAVALVVVSGLVACAKPEMEATQVYRGPRLPPPTRVLVSDLAVTPDEVKLDRGLSSRLVSAAQGTPRTEQEIAVGRRVVNAMSEAVVTELRKRGIPAERAAGGPSVGGGSDLLVEGQLISIDEGNRTQRNVIGLGAGRSDVQADVQLLYRPVGSAPFLLVNYEGASTSGRKPGMAETMGVGAIGRRLASGAALGAAPSAASEAFRAEVRDDAQRMGKDVADRIADYYTSQGWR
ncbi:DUF4410 domain-containing protein [Azospirillum canadense]|uniref:DUF4410 domain-containing protein n=1 Tax=Azospirillum canadense TaxID=403962 RepID=UPI0022261C3E|nr:DUF4410 domain-containing protein [Azospirillum canadense]MCW2243054.1 hypothetical protein [Azospirillum canadense]